MDVGILGAGALGGLFGAKVTAAGFETTLVDTWTEHVRAINENGLRVRTPEGGQTEVHPMATTDATGLDPVDVLFVTVKTDVTVSALEAATSLIDDGTAVVSLQNGFTAHETIPDLLESGRFVGGTTRHGARVAGPGEIVHDATGTTVVGGNGKATETVAGVLETAGFDVETARDVRPLLWDKQYISIGVKPTAALTGLPNGELLESDAAASILEQLVVEADEVREMLGVESITADPVAMVRAFCRENPDHVSSALVDVRHGRQTEIAHINGAIVRYGDQCGVRVPYNRVVTDLVLANEYRYLGETDRSHEHPTR